MSSNKTLLVGYGTDKANWGNRATSIALYSLISEGSNSIDVVWAKEKRIRELPNLILSGLKKIHYLDTLPLAGKVISTCSAYIKENFPLASLTDKSPLEVAKQIIHGKIVCRSVSSVLDRIDASESVIINGEGDVIFSHKPRETLYFLLLVGWLSKIRGKRLYFVNSIYSGCPTGSSCLLTEQYVVGLLCACDGISFRDELSLKLAKSRNPSLNASYVPDALFSWSTLWPSSMSPSVRDSPFRLLPFFEETGILAALKVRKFIALSGSSLVPMDKKLACSLYCKFIECLRSEGYEVILLEPCPGDSYLKDVAVETGSYFLPSTVPIVSAWAVLGCSSVLISGRYHPSILAAVTGTPSVFFRSNSHKTLSVQDVIGLDVKKEEFEYPPAPGDFSALVNKIHRLDSDFVRKKVFESAAVNSELVRSYYLNLF